MLTVHRFHFLFLEKQKSQSKSTMGCCFVDSSGEEKMNGENVVVYMQFLTINSNPTLKGTIAFSRNVSFKR